MQSNRRKFLKASLGGLAGAATLPLIGGLTGCAHAPAPRAASS